MLKGKVAARNNFCRNANIGMGSFEKVQKKNMATWNKKANPTNTVLVWELFFCLNVLVINK